MTSSDGKGGASQERFKYNFVARPLAVTSQSARSKVFSIRRQFGSAPHRGRRNLERIDACDPKENQVTWLDR
jgi:hypothetical protein